MKYGQFLANVRERGEYASTEEADQVTRIVLARLGARLAAGKPRD